MSQPTTLGALRDTGYRSRPVKTEIRENLLDRLRSGETAFPGIVGFDDTVLPQLETALLAGHDLVLLGERGQGKTRLMRTISTLLDGMARHTREGYAFQQRAATVGFRQAVRERDEPFGDHKRRDPLAEA